MEIFEVDALFSFWHHAETNSTLYLTPRYSFIKIGKIEKEIRHRLYKKDGKLILELQNKEYKIKSLSKASNPYSMVLINADGKEINFEGQPINEW